MLESMDLFLSSIILATVADTFGLTFCTLGNFLCFIVVCGFFSFQDTIRVSNKLDQIKEVCFGERILKF